MSSADIHKLISRFARQVRRARAVETAGIVGVIAGALTIIILVIAWRFDVSSLRRLALMGIIIGGSMALTWLIRMLFPLQKARAAALIDSRYGLQQQLITAEELLRRDAPGTWDDLVFSRALAATKNVGLQPNVWRRSRRLPAALGLALLAGLVAVFLPIGENPFAQDAAERMAALSQARRDAIAGELQRIRPDDISPANRERLEAIAKAIEANDPEAFKKLIEQAEKQSPDWKLALPEDVQADLGFRNPSETLPELALKSPLPSETEPETPLETVSVYHPAYNDSNLNPVIKPRKMELGQIAYDDAWRIARDEAQKNLIRDQLPREYRQIVRRFYDLNAVGEK